jgi:hypothetical protein
LPHYINLNSGNYFCSYFSHYFFFGESVKMNFHLLLIKNGANPTVITKTYHKLSLVYHPDKNKDQTATALFQQLNAAYKTLIGPKNLPKQRMSRKTLKPCRHCDKVFMSTSARSQHEQSHGGKGTRTCSGCQLVFTKRCNMLRHAIKCKGDSIFLNNLIY